jgi:hypothetical protein
MARMLVIFGQSPVEPFRKKEDRAATRITNWNQSFADPSRDSRRLDAQQVGGLFHIEKDDLKQANKVFCFKPATKDRCS